MSDQAPLALTLEEALAELSLRNLTLAPPVEGRIATWGIANASDAFEEFDTWEIAASVALKRQVVARDEAAKLKAAIKEWAAAQAQLNEAIITESIADEYRAGEARYRAATDNLRRLAGGETE